MKDLFGNDINELRDLPKPPREKPKRSETPKGYADRPGTGPEGETCKTCQNAAAVRHNSKVYHKCLLLQGIWTNSYGTDIRLKSPACSRWQARIHP